jgi:hypothetical protein
MTIVRLVPNSLARLCLIMALASTLSAPMVRAHGDDDHEEESASEGRHTTIGLVATQFAPTAARGIAELEAESEHGVVTGKLEIEMRGLLAGDYTIVVWDRAFASNVVLGVISVSDDDDRGEGEGAFPLSADVASHIGMVQVKDAVENIIFTGDFANVPDMVNSRLMVRVPTIADSAGTNAVGFVMIKEKVRRGKGKGSFLLHATGLERRATLTLFVNGEEIGPVKTNPGGRVHLRRSYEVTNQSGINSVEVRNAGGDPVLHVDL